MAPDDERLPAARVLLGGTSRALVSTAVEAFGGRLADLERRQVVYRPGTRLTVRYSATVGWGGGEPRDETIVAVADRTGPVPGALVLEADGLQVSLFRYPHDPLLPGLVAATTPSAVAELLGAPTPRLRAVTYRPTDRAVVRSSTDGSAGPVDHYLKVKPPAELPALTARLAALAGRAPVPEVAAVFGDLGIMAMPALPGTTMRDALRARADALPDPDAVLDALSSVTAVAVPDARPVRSPADRAGGYARLLAAVLPPSRARLDRLVARIAERETPPATSLVHGDFHPAQVLAVGRRITGVLDVDDAGLGRPTDDLATFLGHLASLSLDDASGSTRAYLTRALDAFEGLVDGDELRRQTAAVILGLATGPHRVQATDWRGTTRRRIGLAERWIAGDVRSLRTAS